MTKIKNKTNRRILVIDDHEAIHADYRAILGAADIHPINVDEEEAALFGAALNSPKQAYFELDSAFQGREGLEKVQQSLQAGRPYAMAFVDVRMPPGWDGVETVQRIWQVDPQLQVVICTAHSDYSWREMIRKLGKTDQMLILKKPFDNIEVHQMASSLTQKWDLLNNLEQMVKRRIKQIAETRDITVFALAKLAESRDPETGEHLERLRYYSQILAEKLANEGLYADEINEQFLKNLYRSSPLHDIGKVGIPDAVLLKPGRLNADEFKIMEKHTLIGEEAIKMAARQSNSGGFLNMGAKIARSHHERFDGSGYPDGLSGKDIPLPARIVALADVFDAITSARVYKSATQPEVAKSMIINEAGKHFDPVVVETFCVCWDNFLNAGGFVDNSKPESKQSDASGNRSL
jgi:putative two-component system response regulator